MIVLRLSRSARTPPIKAWLIDSDPTGNARIHRITTGKEQNLGRLCVDHLRDVATGLLYALLRH